MKLVYEFANDESTPAGWLSTQSVYTRAHNAVSLFIRDMGGPKNGWAFAFDDKKPQATITTPAPAAKVETVAEAWNKQLLMHGVNARLTARED
jgi:hypothetical protein